MQEDQKLLNINFILLCFCNLTFCMSFHMLIPVLPLYFTQDLGISRSMTGLVVSLYSLAALIARPFSGFIVDRFQRKPVYIACMIPFLLFTACYIFLVNIYLLAVLRLLHGAAFGSTQTSISTMAVDAIPVNKMGTGIGFFGMLNNVSMAAGPMLGLLIIAGGSFRTVFFVSTGLALFSFMLGMLVKAKPRVIHAISTHKLELHRFILTDAIGMAVCLILCCIPFGFLTNYISLYAADRHIEATTGFFFVFLAAGMILSRFISSRLVDKGYLTRVILPGKIMIILSFILFLEVQDSFVLFSCAAIFGVGYGLLSPAYQTKFLSIADADHKGTANSTFFLSWDVGMGLAVFSGGIISDLTSLGTMYMIGAALVALSMVILIPIRLRMRVKKA